MSFNVNITNSGDAGLETVFGKTQDGKSFSLDLDKATPEQQETCVSFLNLVGAHSFVNILNSAHNFMIVGYVIVSGADEETVDVDYATLSNIDKGKINAFANLLESIAQ